ncbi:MAG: PP2C family protein-serine/threonine phosphatase [Marinobacter sp.]
MRAESVAFTHRGAVRDHNEDAFVEFADSGLWVVADGMGGYRAGDVASQLICDTVTSARGRYDGMLGKVELEQAIQRANQRIRQYGREQLAGQTLGSTVVALLVDRGVYHLFWAGDSRCYLLRNNEIIQLSRDHSQVADMVEQGLLDEHEAERHPLAHVITRALGVEDGLALDYRSGSVHGGDRFMLCSDGVSKELGCAEIRDFLSGGPIHEVSQAIMHSLLVGRCGDNITCIIIKLSEDCYSPERVTGGEDQTIPMKLRLP